MYFCCVCVVFGNRTDRHCVYSCDVVCLGVRCVVCVCVFVCLESRTDSNCVTVVCV